jgi:hypothetical protein
MYLSASPLSKALSTDEVVLISVEALDALIAELIRSSAQTVDYFFLDWVADKLTPRLEAAITDAMRTQRFIDSLSLGDPRIALRAWVRYWVCPKIRKDFEKYAVYCPCTREAPIVFYRGLK